MSNNRALLLAATTTGILFAFVFSDPAHARRDTTVDVCPPGLICEAPSPGHGRGASGGPSGGGDDSADDDSSDDDSSEDDVRDDVDSDDTDLDSTFN